MTSQKTTTTVSFRLTFEQRAIVEQRAAASGLTVAEFIKSAVLAASPSYSPRRKASPVPGLVELKKAVADVSRVGANFNKLAKAAYRLHKYLTSVSGISVGPEAKRRLEVLAYEVEQTYRGEVAARDALDEAAALLLAEVRKRGDHDRSK